MFGGGIWAGPVILTARKHGDYSRTSSKKAPVESVFVRERGSCRHCPTKSQSSYVVTSQLATLRRATVAGVPIVHSGGAGAAIERAAESAIIGCW